MTHRCLTELPKNSAAFYQTAQRYGHFLWQAGHAGRALLALTRSLYADIPEQDPVLKQWPLPYAAIHWIAYHHHSDDFPGNPRISFQHQASRLRGPRQAVRAARAWAAWALVREARPSLPGDPSDPIREPTTHEILDALKQHGLPGESEIWKRTLARRFRD